MILLQVNLHTISNSKQDPLSKTEKLTEHLYLQEAILTQLIILKLFLMINRDILSIQIVKMKMPTKRTNLMISLNTSKVQLMIQGIKIK